MLNVVRNVFLILIVLLIKLASTINAKILVLVSVDKMQNVMSSIMFQCVVAHLNRRAMHLFRAFMLMVRKVSSIISVNLLVIQFIINVILTLHILDPIITEPCTPSPCGQNSICRPINNQAVCSCVPGYIGTPPTCRPECIRSSDCNRNEVCTNQKCMNPCPGTCGVGSQCQVINHSPICSCPQGYTGDPFIRCLPIRKKRTKIII